MDATSVILNDPIADAETQSGASPHVLGGEEGIEHVRQVRLRDARTVVSESDPDRPVQVLRADAKNTVISAFGDSFLSVLDKVPENLLHLARIGQGQRDAGGKLDPQIDVAGLQGSD